MVCSVMNIKKIVIGAAGQIGGLLPKCSERAFFPRFSPFLLSEKGTGGSCETSLGMYGTPSRIGGDVYSLGAPTKY